MFLSYWYFAKEGIKINAKLPSPNTNNGPAPGQCILMNKIANTVKLQEIAPEINAKLFICV